MQSHLRTIRFDVMLAVAMSAFGCSRHTEPSSQTPANSPSNAAPVESTSTPTPAPQAWQQDDLLKDDFAVEEGFRELTLSDFESYFAKPPKDASAPTWWSVGKTIVCSGKPKGYLYSREKFKDFTLRLEFRFAPPAESAKSDDFNPNTGVLVFITEPHKQWPKSLEVQGKFAELGTIKPNGGAANVEITDDAAARESVRKPVGEWNALEIVATAGGLTASLNGTKVCESQPGDVSEGAIGLQSEDFEVHFRRIRVKTE